MSKVLYSEEVIQIEVYFEDTQNYSKYGMVNIHRKKKAYIQTFGGKYRDMHAEKKVDQIQKKAYRLAEGLLVHSYKMRCIDQI